MKTLAARLAIVVMLGGCTGDDRGEPGPSAGEAPLPDAVRAELVEMGEQDQAMRQGLTAERMQDTIFLRDMLRGDSARSLRLRQIVESHGWPDSTRAGAEASAAAFLVLQHSPFLDFQKAMLPTLEELARRDELPRAEAAMLIDRVLMHDGVPQRYGTQFSLEDGRFALHPVEDEAGLEERRRTMGLPPMAEYMKMMEEFYGTAVTRDR